MDFKKVVVAGGGVLGSQIAYQTAYCGFSVTVWLRSEGSIERSKPKFERWKKIYQDTLESYRDKCGTAYPYYAKGLVPDLKTLTPEKIDELKAQAQKAFDGLVYETDMAKAFADADLIIESVAEDPAQKIEFYKSAAPHIPEKTVLVTNSSTLLPSQFAEYTGRPEKYLALHFANEIWSHNTAEVMGQPATEQTYYDQVAEFAEAISMVPLKLKKEQPGYILNSMLVPFLSAGQALWAKDVADPETIDLTWRLATGAPAGPFQILDVVGLTTAYNIVSMNPAVKDPESVYGKIAAKLKEMIDAGKTGVNAGEGFYKYK